MTGDATSSALVYPLGPCDNGGQIVYRGQHLFFASEDFDFDLLRDSLHKLITATPFLGGTVRPAATPGWLEVSAPFRPASELLTFADKRGALDYAESRARGFPPSDFGQDFDPCPFFSSPPCAVLCARVSIMRGGVLLSAFLHHAPFDGQGAAIVLRAWAEVCRTGRAVRLDIDRASMSLGLARGEGKLEDHPTYLVRPVDDGLPPPPVADAAPPPQYPAVSTMLYLSEAKVAQLKKDAFAGLPAGEWISTHDAVCALLWMRIATVRKLLGALPDDDAPAGLRNSVDTRKRLSPPVPPTYTGNCPLVVEARATVGELAAPGAALSTFARRVRESINAQASDAFIRDELALVARFKDDLRVISSEWAEFLVAGVVVTSWARLDTYGLDWGSAFGAGKRCERIRHPWAYMAGMIAPMPMGVRGPQDKGLEVLVMLPPDQNDVFAKDEVIRKYAEIVY